MKKTNVFQEFKGNKWRKTWMIEDVQNFKSLLIPKKVMRWGFVPATNSDTRLPFNVLSEKQKCSVNEQYSTYSCCFFTVIRILWIYVIKYLELFHFFPKILGWGIERPNNMTDQEDNSSLGAIVSSGEVEEKILRLCLGQIFSWSPVVYLSNSLSFVWLYLFAFWEIIFRKLVT